MKTKSQQTAHSLLWVEFKAPDQQPYWARITRLLADIPEDERTPTIDLLKAGKLIAFEESGICIQCKPMTSQEMERLDDLLAFEAGGFRLATFRQGMALFFSDKDDYYSMNEMMERGFLPTPSIAVSQLTKPVTDFHGKLIDVFVPVGLGVIYFTHPDRQKELARQHGAGLSYAE